MSSEEPRVDQVDRKILAALQDNLNISIAELAHRVGLTQTPCWKRIQKLEASGVIERRVALLSPEKIGLGLTVYVQIEASDHSAAWLEQFSTIAGNLPEVMELYRMAGDVDYMMRVVVPDMAAYDVFYRRLIEQIQLKNVTSRFAMERLKFTTAYQIPEATARV